MRHARNWNFALGLLFFVAGCGGPTAAERDNRRVVDEILTALTLKNVRLLEAAAKRATARHDAGQLTDKEFKDLQGCIEKGRHGDWTTAENDAYEFRKQHPFVHEGQ
jgi:hypothetical protein